MNKINQKRENEKRILKVMIDIYQRKHPQVSSIMNHWVAGKGNRKHKQESQPSHDQISSRKTAFINQ